MMTVETTIRMKKTAHRKMVRRKKQNEIRTRAAARGRYVLGCNLGVVTFSCKPWLSPGVCVSKDGRVTWWQVLLGSLICSKNKRLRGAGETPSLCMLLSCAHTCAYSHDHKYTYRDTKGLWDLGYCFIGRYKTLGSIPSTGHKGKGIERTEEDSKECMGH